MRNPLAVSAVLAFVFFVACVDHVQHAAALPFLRSLVACDTPPTPPEAVGWSGSPKCGKLDLVVRDAQRRDGSLLSILLLVHLVAAPLMGALADRRGQRLVLLLSVALHVAADLLMALAAIVVAPIWSNVAIYSAYVLLGSVSKSPSITSLLGSLVAEEERSRVFTLNSLMHAASVVVALPLNWLLLHAHITDYSSVWLALAVAIGLSALPLAAVASRQPPAADDAVGESGKLLAPPPPATSWLAEVRDLALGPLALVRKSGFLRAFCLGLFFFILGIGGSLVILSSFCIAILGWPQERLQMLFIIMVPFALGALAFGNYVLFPRVGAGAAWLFAVACAFASQAALLAAPWWPPAVGVSLAFLGMACLGFPAANTLIFEKVEGSEVTQAMALLSVAASLAFAVAAPAASALFDPSARGAAAITPFLAGLALIVVAAAVFVRLLEPWRRSGPTLC